MFIINDKLIELYRVPESENHRSQAYILLIDEHLSLWLSNLSLLHWRQLIFMSNNAPSHTPMATASFLTSLGIKGETFMIWLPSSLELNPIKQVW